MSGTQPTLLAQTIKLWANVNEVEYAALAKQWGTSKTTVTRFLNNGRMPNGPTMARIIAWLLTY